MTEKIYGYNRRSGNPFERARAFRVNGSRHKKIRTGWKPVRIRHGLSVLPALCCLGVERPDPGPIFKPGWPRDPEGPHFPRFPHGDDPIIKNPGWPNDPGFDVTPKHPRIIDPGFDVNPRSFKPLGPGGDSAGKDGNFE